MVPIHFLIIFHIKWLGNVLWDLKSQDDVSIKYIHGAF